MSNIRVRAVVLGVIVGSLWTALFGWQGWAQFVMFCMWGACGVLISHLISPVKAK